MAAETEVPWYTPDPKSRAIYDPNERIIPRLKRWMRSLVSKKPRMVVPEASGASLDQLMHLKSDLDLVQQRIDALIGAAKK